MEGKVLSRDEAKKITEVIRAIEKKPESSDFLKPVDYKGLGLDDYPVIIKHPMDISTVKRKLKTGKYNALSEVVSDLMLIWENCRIYNQIDSTIVNQADILEAVMRRQCEINNIPIDLPQSRIKEEVKSEPVPDTVTMSSKLEFTEKIRKVNHEILADIVKIIENECRNAIEELETDKIMIKVDNLTKPTFEKLLQTVNTAIDEPKPQKKQRNSIS